MVSRKLVDCSTNVAVDSGGLDVAEPMRSLLQQLPQRRAWQLVYLRGSFLELIGKFSSRHLWQQPRQPDPRQEGRWNARPAQRTPISAHRMSKSRAHQDITSGNI